MSNKKFTSPMQIVKCKLGDSLIFSHTPTTPYDPLLKVETLGGTTVISGQVADDLRNNEYFWFVDISSLNFSALTYYVFKIVDYDPSLTTPDPNHWIVYVTNDYIFEGLIDRNQGLAGYNIRKYNYTYADGNLTGFSVKTYATKAKLEAAEAGTADDYLAYYVVTIRNNSGYNRYYIESKRSS